MYEGGLNEEKTKFNIPSLKVKYEGKGEFTPTFVIPEVKLSKDLYNTEYVMYEDSSKVSVEEGGEILCNSIEPYFNRTPEHFCSHQHAPSSGKIYGPAIIKGENTVYFAHKIFSQYHNYGSVWCKKLFINAIDTLYVLHYIPERRCQRIDVIEDVIPLYNLEMKLKNVGDKLLKGSKSYEKSNFNRYRRDFYKIWTCR